MVFVTSKVYQPREHAGIVQLLGDSVGSNISKNDVNESRFSSK